ncbi:hypothetical protein D3C81_1332970 [compost metagenome]
MLLEARITGFNVAKARFGMLWLDTEGHQPSLSRQLLSMMYGLGEGLLILDQMVGGQQQQAGVVSMLFLQGQGRSGYGGCRVPAERFEDVALLTVQFQLSVLLFSFEEKLPIGHCHDLDYILKFAGSLKGFLHQCLAVR